MAGERRNNKTSTAASAVDQINALYGKLPPQAIDVEEAVLGTLMIEEDAYDTVADILDVKSFYKEEHRKIFEVIKDLATHEKKVDLLTVTQSLTDRNELDEVGGALYITQLTNRVTTSAHLEFHARIIAQKYIQRELIRISSEIQTKSYDSSTDVDDLIDFAETSLFGVTEGNIKKEALPIKPLLKEATELIEEASRRKDGLSGIPSGFTALDRITSGWQNTDLVIVAARPAMGKTAFVLSMARNIGVDYKKPIAIFSLEMSNIQLMNRLIVSETEIDAEKIKNGHLADWEWEQFHRKVSNLEEAPIYIDDTPALSIFEFRAKCRRLKMQCDISMVIIDYLQLMTAGKENSRGNREQEVSMISRSLKAIAKEINIPIIALSQLNRSVETREGKRPQLSDLRESGAIEQDADLVLFIHRPEYYGITEDENNNSLLGIAEIIVAKHRNGSVGDVKLAFRKNQVKFVDLDTAIPEEIGDGMVGQTFSSKMNSDSGSGMPVNSSFENEDSGDGAPF